MIIIGENLSIMSTKIRGALNQKDPGPVREMALAMAGAGVDLIDINLGPARKEGAELMTWVVKTVQEVVDLPLSLDTTNVEAMEAGLKVHKGRALINSVSARPERMQALMPLAKKYDAAFIGLTLGIEGLPRDANERGLLATQLVAEASHYGISEEDIWVDPVALPVNTQQMQIQGCTDFFIMLSELGNPWKTICGLSNTSNGAPSRLRGILNRTYMIILRHYGIYSVIANAFDLELMAIARGRRSELESLIYEVIDSEDIDISKLSGEELDYVKTARVLLGRTIYSDSWLEL